MVLFMFFRPGGRRDQQTGGGRAYFFFFFEALDPTGTVVVFPLLVSTVFTGAEGALPETGLPPLPVWTAATATLFFAGTFSQRLMACENRISSSLLAK